MNIKRKLELVAQGIDSIASHSDEDAVVLHAALDRVSEFVAAGKAKVSDRSAARVKDALSDAAE